MARNKQTSNKIGTEVKSTTPATPVAKVVTPVRNTAIPKVPAAQSKREITNEMIATRAYYISISGQGGSEYDNWTRAEYELRNGVVA
jgi:hypothetical protein